MNEKVKVHISRGNMKVGRVPNFSLTPGASCSETARRTCLVGGCYACKAYVQYPGTREAWDDNTWFALHDIPELEKRLNAYIAKRKPAFFRVHVGGDFITREYAEMWARVAGRHPGTRFLAFTKQWDNVRGVEFPANFSLVLSGWPGTEIPADLAAKYPRANMVLSADEIPADGLHCPGNCESCGMCWQLAEIGRNVYFVKH